MCCAHGARLHRSTVAPQHGDILLHTPGSRIFSTCFVCKKSIFTLLKCSVFSLFYTMRRSGLCTCKVAGQENNGFERNSHRRHQQTYLKPLTTALPSCTRLPEASPWGKHSTAPARHVTLAVHSPLQFALYISHSPVAGATALASITRSPLPPQAFPERKNVV